MKRKKNLLEKIVDLDNLYTAYWKARKGKEAKHEVQKYASNVDANILALQQQLLNGNVAVGNYRYFTIFDPKQRLICAAPFEQRVLHHALMNVCGPLLDSRQIYDSYASQVGKGTYAALQRAMQLHKRHKWCLKIDIRKYFDSINHDVLKHQLSAFFKEELLLKIFFDIIDSYDSGDSHRGLPIGNLTSQYFANHYLSGVDHFAYEQAKVKGYVRYMDDILVYDDDRDGLLRKSKEIRQMIECRMNLSLKVFDLRPTSVPTQFLGYRISQSCVQLSQRSMKRFRHKMEQYYDRYQKTEWTEKDYQRHLSPLLAFVLKANSFNFRKRVLESTCNRGAS